jgi:hypothetical protein
MSAKQSLGIVAVIGWLSQGPGTIGSAIEAGGQASSGECISAAQLLDGYAATQDRLRSCWFQEEETADATASGYGQVPKGTAFSRIERWVDGRRYAYRNCSWGNVGMGEFLAQDRAVWVVRVWDGETFYQYDKAEQSPIGHHPGALHFTCYRTNPDEGRRLHDGRGYTQLSGFFIGDDYQRVDATLREAASIAVRPKPGIMGGSPCVVLEAQTKRGRYRAWFDPAHGYHLARIEIQRGPGDLADRRVLKAGESVRCVMEDVRFKEVEGVWVPMEARLQEDEIGSPQLFSKTTRLLKRTKFVLNPDHQALGSFDPRRHIDDGALVPSYAIDHVGRRHSKLGPQYVWQSGAKFVYDPEGRRVVAGSQPGLLPIVKTLPELRQFGLTFPSNQRVDRNLICFCDLNQAASQEAVVALKRDQSRLQRQGVAVAAVQAAERGVPTGWPEDNPLPFPLGQMNEGPEGRVLQAWRAERLPWLILADAKGVILAEGFDLAQLDRTLKKNPVQGARP